MFGIAAVKNPGLGAANFENVIERLSCENSDDVGFFIDSGQVFSPRKLSFSKCNI